MKKEITIQSHDGGTFSAHAVYPDTDLPAPAVIVIQEIFGVNDAMRKICEHLSQAGFISICPDLFWRQEPGVRLTDRTPEEWKKAMALYEGFDVSLGVEDLRSTLAYIRRDKECTGKVGTVGYCLGGKLAFLMAARSDADCNVCYYGVGIEELLVEAPKIKSPLLMHMAEKDKFVPPKAREKIIGALKDMKNVEGRVYPGADHAFARPGGENFDKDAAQEANYHTADFLATNLSGHK